MKNMKKLYLLPLLTLFTSCSATLNKETENLLSIVVLICIISVTLVAFIYFTNKKK